MISVMIRSLLLLFCLNFLAACGSSGGDRRMDPPPANGGKGDDDNGEVQGAVRLNQLGFAPGSRKLAVVPDVAATGFRVVEADSGEEVFSGELGAAAEWAPAEESVKLADFSGLTAPGRYRIRVDGLDDSHPFAIGAGVYGELNDAALRAYYFNRASAGLLAEHAGDYARPLGHPDTEVFVHESAATNARPAGSALSAPKGWYDAGDFGKYVVNSGISTYTLLAAYEHFPGYYAGRELNIPESGDSVPDILDEARWNLEWLLAMQDEDGGVYHKLTTLNFAGAVMPHQATADRHVIGKGTSATLNFAATLAAASRVFEPFDEALAAQMLSAAEDAWVWAGDHPDVAFRNPSDVATGEYGGNNLTSNFAWAAAELYITTGEDAYYQAFADRAIDIGVPAWPDSRGLAWMSLAFHRDGLSEAADTDLIEQRLLGLADQLARQDQDSAYRLAMGSSDFFWGSNSQALNRAMMLLQGYRLDPARGDYRDTAQSLLDYILGRNPTGYSYVTGHGHRTPVNIHHRASEADDLEAPVPGFVVGGPNPHNQSDCEASDSYPDYPTDVPAKAYLDHWCSYSTNEVAINWNAPLVYVSGALEALAGE